MSTSPARSTTSSTHIHPLTLHRSIRSARGLRQGPYEVVEGRPRADEESLVALDPREPGRGLPARRRRRGEFHDAAGLLAVPVAVAVAVAVAVPVPVTGRRAPDEVARAQDAEQAPPVGCEDRQARGRTVGPGGGAEGVRGRPPRAGRLRDRGPPHRPEAAGRTVETRRRGRAGHRVAGGAPRPAR